MTSIEGGLRLQNQVFSSSRLALIGWGVSEYRSTDDTTSEGTQQMLEWTAAGEGARLMGLIHHTDAEREWAYDRKSEIGTLDKALDEAIAKGWTVVGMKRDWKTVFPFER